MNILYETLIDNVIDNHKILKKIQTDHNDYYVDLKILTEDLKNCDDNILIKLKNDIINHNSKGKVTVKKGWKIVGICSTSEKRDVECYVMLTNKFDYFYLIGLDFISIIELIRYIKTKNGEYKYTIKFSVYNHTTMGNATFYLPFETKDKVIIFSHKKSYKEEQITKYSFKLDEKQTKRYYYDWLYEIKTKNFENIKPLEDMNVSSTQVIPMYTMKKGKVGLIEINNKQYIFKSTNVYEVISRYRINTLRYISDNFIELYYITTSIKKRDNFIMLSRPLMDNVTFSKGAILKINDFYKYKHWVSEYFWHYLLYVKHVPIFKKINDLRIKLNIKVNESNTLKDIFIRVLKYLDIKNSIYTSKRTNIKDVGISRSYIYNGQVKDFIRDQQLYKKSDYVFNDIEKEILHYMDIFYKDINYFLKMTLLQLIYAQFCSHSWFGFQALDLHAGNVMFKRVNETGLVYIINNHIFRIPPKNNLLFILKLWDYEIVSKNPRPFEHFYNDKDDKYNVKTVLDALKFTGTEKMFTNRTITSHFSYLINRRNLFEEFIYYYEFIIDKKGFKAFNKDISGIDNILNHEYLNEFKISPFDILKTDKVYEFKPMEDFVFPKNMFLKNKL